MGYRKLITLVCVLLANPLFAQTTSIETDWLRATKGFEEKKIGAQVYAVNELIDEGLTRINISIPRDPSKEIEEVIVIGQRKNISDNLQSVKPIEVIRDYEAGRSGIVIHLGENTPFKLLINYIEYDAP